MNAAEKGMVMHPRVNAIGVAVARQGDAAGINEGREHEIMSGTSCEALISLAAC